MKADLAKLRALHAMADAKDNWVLATSNSWRRVLTVFGHPVIVPCVDRDGHPNLDRIENLELAIAAVNALPDLIAEITRLRAIAEAVERAPVGWCLGQCGPDSFSPTKGAVIQMDCPELIKGQRVRLLTIGTAGHE